MTKLLAEGRHCTAVRANRRRTAGNYNPFASAERAAADRGEAGEAVKQSGYVPATLEDDSYPAETLSPICSRRRLLRPPHRRLAGKESEISICKRCH